MLFLTLLSLQTTDPAIDTSKRWLPERCRAATVREDELVVCGRRIGQSPYRIGPLAPVPPTLPTAEFSLSDAVGVTLAGEQGEVGGFTTNRAVISLKIKF